MKMEQGARIVVEDWLQAQSDDVLHFITDETKLREAEAFAAASRQVGAIPKLTVLPSASIQAGDSVAQMRRIMSYATAVIGATSDSFITTEPPMRWIMSCAGGHVFCRCPFPAATDVPCWSRTFWR